MKKLFLFTILLLLCFTPLVNAEGIQISPSIFDSESADSYTLTIINNEKSPVTFKLDPWFFKNQDSYTVPLTSEEMKKLPAPSVKVSDSTFTIDADETQEIDISYKKPNNEYIQGILISTVSDKGQIAINYAGSSLILYRGEMQYESIDLSAKTPKEFTLTNNTKLKYSLYNTGEYISKLTGEIKILDKNNKLISTVPITSNINKDLKPSENIQGEIEYTLPVKNSIEDLITKFKFEITAQSSTGRIYTTNTEIYYINPLVPIGIGVLLLLITIILLTYKKKTKTAKTEIHINPQPYPPQDFSPQS